MRVGGALALLWAAAGVGAAMAAPCENTLDKVPQDERANWSRAAQEQVNTAVQKATPGAPQVRSVTLDQVFQQDGYVLLHVTPDAGAPVWLFYPGSPAQRQPVATWRGTQPERDRGQVRERVLREAAGIPWPLAACFAETVTP